ncbi:hypothetical protein A3F02_00230 [Candidatus Curtissbacteria bacterium RIFCSPHIGHO2_12_FULL_38_9b]|uniref:Reverse transcriptase domain-containing protein n=1 Tax=Candidatus Curtissbacteria bacterium RIFCSPHIGHO2_12_FULL_38_9b TaxID=1797720 RepID=A0A1F5GXZ0_9BACT|nr:MAG: hypothetical protein A3F02_00230 [Candidatus Curtissbacteria bacterium RIFCSPHIGHO2_12_FULL_38_9b]
MNELDQFVKHELKIKLYIRYADDFLILDKSKQSLLHCFETVKCYLEDQLKLEIHPNKIFLRKHSWGIDFCGYIILPHYILPRTTTKRRIIRKVLRKTLSGQSIQSYLGYFSYANSHFLTQRLKNQIWFRQNG